jgi:hypothetical protein
MRSAGASPNVDEPVRIIPTPTPAPPLEEYEVGWPIVSVSSLCGQAATTLQTDQASVGNSNCQLAECSLRTLVA